MKHIVSTYYIDRPVSCGTVRRKPTCLAGQKAPKGIPAKLRHLSHLSGLTEFERYFVTRCLDSPQIPMRERRVLAVIWQRHGRRQ